MSPRPPTAEPMEEAPAVDREPYEGPGAGVKGMIKAGSSFSGREPRLSKSFISVFGMML